jgi:NAD(P)-dependent dehydrogenase (short-subunit alcohol dehydrogenase family)
MSGKLVDVGMEGFVAGTLGDDMNDALKADTLFNLAGQVALVTGAGQGVGRAIARTLSANGARVIVNDFHAERAQAVVEELHEQGGKAVAMPADVSNLGEIRERLQVAQAAMGAVSLLVNNAGNRGPASMAEDLKPFWETDPARWHEYLAVNLIGVMNCCHAVLPGMIKQHYGRIVTITSDASRMLDGYLSDYAAAKAGAAGFMRGIAADSARYGVTANCVSIATITPAMAPEQLEAFLASPQSKAQLSRYLVRRYGLPEDIAPVVLMLCSNSASWITGQNYPVNGGYSPSL